MGLRIGTQLAKSLHHVDQISPLVCVPSDTPSSSECLPVPSCHGQKRKGSRTRSIRHSPHHQPAWHQLAFRQKSCRLRDAVHPDLNSLCVCACVCVSSTVSNTHGDGPRSYGNTRVKDSRNERIIGHGTIKKTSKSSKLLTVRIRSKEGEQRRVAHFHKRFATREAF